MPRQENGDKNHTSNLMAQFNMKNYELVKKK
jgi:hypothetical protein